MTTTPRPLAAVDRRMVWPYALLTLPGLAVLVYWAVAYVGRSWTVLTFPYGYDYGEAPELNRALAVAHLQPFYPFWTGPPYQMANYTPLYSVLNGLFVRIFGLQFQSGRAIAWTSGLLFCAALCWLAWREGRTVLAPIVTALLWFSSHYVWNWTPLAREDELAMLFSIGGLVVFYEGCVRHALPTTEATPAGPSAVTPRDGRLSLGHSGPVWVALLFFLAAIYTRQTTIEAAAACAMYLVVGRPRLGLAFIVTMVLSAGLIFIALDWATRGAFYLNVVTGNINIYHWATVLYLGHQFWLFYQGAAVLAGFYVVTQIALRRQLLFVLWLLVTFAVAVTAGKEGASNNYLLLPWGATCLAAGLAVSRAQALSAWLWTRPHLLALVSRPVALVFPVLVGFALLLDAQLSFHLPYQGHFEGSTAAMVGKDGINGLLRRATDTGWYRRLLPGEPSPRAIEGSYGYQFKPNLAAFDREEQTRIDALVSQAPGDVFDEDISHVLQSGKRIFVQPFEFSEEARLGKWDQTPLLAMIERGQFSLAITTRRLRPGLSFQRYTPEMMEAFSRNYCLAATTHDYFVYRPCNAAGP